jgi:putative sigma-54 modulation protein
MELLGHDFFVFISSGTGKTAIVYKRKDKNYGLIEPVV